MIRLHPSVPLWRLDPGPVDLREGCDSVSIGLFVAIRNMCDFRSCQLVGRFGS